MYFFLKYLRERERESVCEREREVQVGFSLYDSTCIRCFQPKGGLTRKLIISLSSVCVSVVEGGLRG